ncbi:MAG: excisionase family DNA-binding protein [Rhodobacteraceae bacterium]|nr:excisionase family DNA-binding protein [Paracoccaceae bacterium]
MTMMAQRQRPPSAQEAALARASGQLLARYARSQKPLRLHLTDEGPAEPIELPARAVGLLMDILEAMAAGQGILIVPKNSELTTVQAAGVLNVSRPFLIKLLEERKIPHRKMGRHRRMRMEDVMDYKASDDAERENVLDQLVALRRRNRIWVTPNAEP